MFTPSFPPLMVSVTLIPVQGGDKLAVVMVDPFTDTKNGRGTRYPAATHTTGAKTTLQALGSKFKGTSGDE